jgi:histidine triad (HIT) family protein
MDCQFCKIIAGEAEAKVVHADDEVVVFADIRPQAPIHLLVCPREHIPTFMDAPPETVIRLLKTCRLMAERFKVQDGFRVSINNGPGGGQIIFHLHLHFKSGGGRLQESDFIDYPETLKGN